MGGGGKLKSGPLDATKLAEGACAATGATGNPSIHALSTRQERPSEPERAGRKREGATRPRRQRLSAMACTLCCAMRTRREVLLPPRMVMDSFSKSRTTAPEGSYTTVRVWMRAGPKPLRNCVM